MVQVKYIGKHQPNCTINTSPDKAKELVATGAYAYAEKPVEDKPLSVEDKPLSVEDKPLSVEKTAIKK